MHVATFAPDILSALSGAPRDSGARNVREMSLNSTGSRRGFSSVLRSVRGEVRRATTREPEDARPVNQTDHGSRAKETKGINSSAQSDRPSVSSQKTERTRTNKNDDRLADETRMDPEPAPRPTKAGAGSEDKEAIPVSGLMFVSVEPQAADQAAVQTENEPQVLSDEVNVDASSQHPLISPESIKSFTTTLEAFSGRSSLSHVGTAEVIPAAPLRPQNPGIPQVVQASVQKASLEGNVLVAKAETAKVGGELVDDSVSSQAAGQVRAVEDHHAFGASTEQSFSHGRQLGSEGSEQFDELWSGHNRRQMETGELKISQPFVVDHTIANGSVAEATAPGLSRQASSPSGTPAQASPVTQVSSGSRAEDLVQSAEMPVMRSVVVNVTRPDLGHLNIRVAMTNDVVHTHFSSDRLEVGQFIVNGQDRLQAALQSNGLDMGQFRVDIDRQNGGRSFHQGPSQEQGQSWHQASQGTGQDPHDQQDLTRGTLHGLLNLVA